MMRRFDLKIRFDYLRDDQAQMLLRELAEVLQLEVTTDAHLALSKVNRLAPGDFALIARQARLRPVRDIGDLIERLALESGMKRDGGAKTIGFAAS
jgi:Holliday junction resolvasome RuvABC ATP-dependent DNA helicase subunit